MNVVAILDGHEKWLAGEKGFKCADLRGADLGRMKLGYRNLTRANLSRCNLEGAHLFKTNFTAANLSGSNMHRVKIHKTNFTNAILARAFCAFVNFHKADLSGADLSGADLVGSNFETATFTDSWAQRVMWAKMRIVPEGDIIGWKKLRGGRIAKLLIPKEARRSNGFGRRCRAEFAHVVHIVDAHGEPCFSGTSRRDADLKYVAGQRVTPDSWDTDWHNDCSHGINFFITQEEADAY